MQVSTSCSPIFCASLDIIDEIDIINRNFRLSVIKMIAVFWTLFGHRDFEWDMPHTLRVRTIFMIFTTQILAVLELES